MACRAALLRSGERLPHGFSNQMDHVKGQASVEAGCYGRGHSRLVCISFKLQSNHIPGNDHSVIPSLLPVDAAAKRAPTSRRDHADHTGKPIAEQAVSWEYPFVAV